MEFDALVKKLVWKRRDDPSAPSIVFSYIHADRAYYASIKIFDKPFAKGEQVLYKIKDRSLECVVTGLANFIQSLPEPPEREYEKHTQVNSDCPPIVDDDIPF